MEMETFQTFDPALLDQAGLNRHAVFNISQLPADIADSIHTSCPAASACGQLILIGHGGQKLWEAVTAAGIDSEHPIDEFTVDTVQRWFAQCQPHNTYEILYPGDYPIGLQRLGQLAGWHHPTPFMVGIDREWGTWYAYRAVIVADTAFAPTQPLQEASPCASCVHTACISHCPGAALAGGRFDLAKCITYRKQAGSSCKATCLARISCPVGSRHRYCDEQIHHTYSLSMRVIEQYY